MALRRWRTATRGVASVAPLPQVSPMSKIAVYPAFIEPGASARSALEQLEKPGVSHLLVRPAEGGPAQGVVAPMDLVELVTRHA